MDALQLLSDFVSRQLFKYLFFFRLKQLWEESQVENERLRDRLRVTHEDLSKCKDQLDNAFQVVYVAISTLLRALP